ncbi:MAG: DUF7088 domain-containing protein, partial [Leadbetterella sp.]
MFKILKNPFLLIPIIVLFNIVGAFLYFKIDFTEDKRNSISEASTRILDSLDSPMKISVYLEGENLPGGFQRLKRSIESTLTEFQSVAPDHILYEFKNPMDVGTEEQKTVMQEMANRGMQPTSVYDTKNGAKSQQLLYPYAEISYKDKKVPVLLLKGNLKQDPQTQLNQSAEIVEHSLISTIKKLSDKSKKKIALLTDFTSLGPVNFGGLINTLQENYKVFILSAQQSPSFEGLDAIILPKPDKPI